MFLVQFAMRQVLPLKSEPRSGSDRVGRTPFKSQENENLSLVDLRAVDPVALTCPAPTSLTEPSQADLLLSRASSFLLEETQQFAQLRSNAF